MKLCDSKHQTGVALTVESFHKQPDHDAEEEDEEEDVLAEVLDEMLHQLHPGLHGGVALPHGLEQQTTGALLAPSRPVQSVA